MLQGANSILQQCHPRRAPNFLQGAKKRPQKCHRVCAPTIFIWCRDYFAEMPLLTRTKGKGQMSRATMPLRFHPSQPVTGGQFIRAEMPLLRHPTGEANARTQQCRSKSALPTSYRGSTYNRRNATTRTTLERGSL